MAQYESGAVHVGLDTIIAEANQRNTGWKHEHEPYRVNVEQYVTFHRDGYLVVRGLIPQDDIGELVAHTEDLMDGKIILPGVEPPAAHLSKEEKAQYYLRIHMLHRVHEIHERFLLHPRVLDVLQALIGVDVLALQSMLFLKGPGKPGQGYHQDSYYIPTVPDSLIGAWIAVDRADEQNGCLWMTPGSQHEPVYPPKREGTVVRGHGNDVLSDITPVAGVSIPDDSQNDLTKIAAKYPGVEESAIMNPGDVAFFGGRILHRSHSNMTQDRFRRAFVGHYCNARSYTEWHGGNEAHILARGDTHLPFAKPKFGTPCAALLSSEERRKKAPAGVSMMGNMDGDMGMTPHGEDHED